MILQHCNIAHKNISSISTFPKMCSCVQSSSSDPLIGPVVGVIEMSRVLYNYLIATCVTRIAIFDMIEGKSLLGGLSWPAIWRLPPYCSLFLTQIFRRLFGQGKTNGRPTPLQGSKFNRVPHSPLEFSDGIQASDFLCSEYSAEPPRTTLILRS